MTWLCGTRVRPFLVAGAVCAGVVSLPASVRAIVADLAAVALVAAVLLVLSRVSFRPVRRWLGLAVVGALLLLFDHVAVAVGVDAAPAFLIGGDGSVALAVGYVAIAVGVFGLFATLVGDAWIDLLVEVGVVAAVTGVVAWLTVLQFHVGDGPLLADLLVLTTLATSAARVAGSSRLARAVSSSRALCVVASGWIVWFCGDVLRVLGEASADVGEGLVVAATTLIVAGLCDRSIPDDAFNTPIALDVRPATRRWLLIGAAAMVPLSVQVAPAVDAVDRIVLTGAVVLVGGALVLRAERARVFELRARADQEAALRDALSAQRQVDDELRQLAMTRNLFLRAISHQLRTPLTSVMGFARTLDRHGDELDEEVQRDLRHRILGNAERLELVVDALCDLDLLSRGTITPTNTQVDLAAVVRRAVDDTPVVAHEVLLDLADVEVHGDGALLGRAVRRLLDNAVKHTPPGTTISLQLREQVGHAHVEVADNGPGVPPGLHERVFEPLVQGPAAATDPNPGVGLGLALVSHIARLHSGQAWVEDNEGGGARFHLVLPATAEQRAPVVERAATRMAASVRQ